MAASVTQRFAVEWAENPNEVTLKRLETSMYKIVVSTEEWTREALDQIILFREKRVVAKA